MASDSPDTVAGEQIRRLDAALSRLERTLEELAPEADPDGVAEALAAPVAEFNAAAKEALR